MAFSGVVGLYRLADPPGPLFRQLAEVDLLGAGGDRDHHPKDEERVQETGPLHPARQGDGQRDAGEKRRWDWGKQQQVSERIIGVVPDREPIKVVKRLGEQECAQDKDDRRSPASLLALRLAPLSATALACCHSL